MQRKVTGRNAKPSMRRNLRGICSSAAYLIAAIESQPAGGREVRDSIRILRDELNAAGYLEPYKEGRSLRIS